MPTLTEEQERFSAALHNTARTWRQALDRRLKDLGVGQAGWVAIAAIAKSEEPLSQTELADRLAVEDPTMVTMLDRLAKAGFVTRLPSETDRRVKLVALTAEGNKLYAKVRKEAEAFRQTLLADVDLKKLRMATELLEAMQKAAKSAL